MNNNIPQWILRVIEKLLKNDTFSSLTIYVKPGKDVTLEYKVTIKDELDAKYI